jgi:predicted amidohydrolase
MFDDLDKNLLVPHEIGMATVHVVAAAQGGDRYTGHSAVIDPWGSIVVEAENAPAILQAVLEADDVAHAREVNPSLANRRIRS